MRIPFHPMLALALAASIAHAEEITPPEAYCLADAVFAGQARSVRVVTEDDEYCRSLPPPATVAQFNAQVDANGEVCFPIEIRVAPEPPQLLRGGVALRRRYRLHVTHLPPAMSALSLDDAARALETAPHLYSIAHIGIYESDGQTWLLGYPREPAEATFLQTFDPASAACSDPANEFVLRVHATAVQPTERCSNCGPGNVHEAYWTIYEAQVADVVGGEFAGDTVRFAWAQHAQFSPEAHADLVATLRPAPERLRRELGVDYVAVDVRIGAAAGAR